MLTNINIIEMNPPVELQYFCPQASKGQKTSINYKVILVTLNFPKSIISPKVHSPSKPNYYMF